MPLSSTKITIQLIVLILPKDTHFCEYLYTCENKLLFTPAGEKVAAVQSGTNFWIVSHEFGTNKFYAYHLTPTGISSPVISATGQIHSYTPITAGLRPEQVARGYLKFSPDGKKLVSLGMPDESPYITQAYVLPPEIFSFNDTTGAVKSLFLINHPDSIPYYGATFSPDGTKLYLSGGWGHPFIHQFDLTSGSPSTILNTRFQVNKDTTGYPPNGGAMQLATNGKVYISANSSWLDVINNPNAVGISCNYQQKALILTDCPVLAYSTWGLPNFVESYFQTPVPGNACFNSIAADFQFTDTCLNSVTKFFDQTTIFPETLNFWKWNFGDTASGAANLSTIKDPQHTFTKAGKFNVQLITLTDTTAICKSDTVTKIVNIQVCTGVNEIIGSTTQVNVFPNPSTHDFHLTVESKRAEGLKVSICNSMGNVIEFFEKRATPEYNMTFGGELPKGVYLLQVYSDEYMFTKKLVKL